MRMRKKKKKKSTKASVSVVIDGGTTGQQKYVGITDIYARFVKSWLHIEP